jgi:hypothetical protein
MQSYDPNSGGDLSTSIEQLLAQTPEPSVEEKKKGPPQGLIKTPEAPEELEKNIEGSQMAEFATSIDEIMPGPGQMMQDEVMGPPSLPVMGNQKTPRKEKKKEGDSKHPFGLTDEQFFAALAGVSAIIAFSKPVQSRLSTMVPKFMAEGTSDLSMTGMLATALVAALVFYFARQVLGEKA